MAAGFQSDKHRGFVAELAQTRFKGGKTFRAGEHFYRFEQHVAATIYCRGAVKALSNVDTNEDVESDYWGSWGFSFSFLLGMMEGPFPILVAKSRMFPLPARMAPGFDEGCRR